MDIKYRIIGYDTKRKEWMHLFWWTRDAESGKRRAKADSRKFSDENRYSMFMAIDMKFVSTVPVGMYEEAA